MTRLQGRMRKLREATGGSVNTGCMSDATCWLLHGLIRHQRPEVVIQTGHLWGKSALVVLEALCDEDLDSDQGDRDFGAFVEGNSPPSVKGELHSVDPHPMGVKNWLAGVDLLNHWYKGRFHFHHQPSSLFFEEADPAERIFGIVDGDHTIQGATEDLYNLSEMGAQAIFLDDTAWLPYLGQIDLDGYAKTYFPEYNGATVYRRFDDVH